MRNIYYLFSVKDKFFTDLSQILLEQKLFDSFYGLAYARTPVLKNVIYNNVSYVTDIMKKKGQVDYDYLNEIEKKYTINLSEMIHTDRHLCRYPKNKRLYLAQELIRLFMKEINDYQITFVFPEGVDDFISFFAALYCKHHNIKFFYPIEVGYAERSCISSEIYPEPNEFRQTFKKTLHLFEERKINSAHIETEIDMYVNGKRKPSYYLGTNEADYRTLKTKDIKIFFQYIIDYLRDHTALPYEKNPLFLPFYRLIKINRKINYKNFIKKKALEMQVLKKMNYFIYPLHFEPESSTLIQARWFHDQQKIIEMLSKSMPINFNLIVKEHRISIGRRELKFYKTIEQYHNVFFVNDTIDTYPLIENCKGVIVISSTMGLEALLLNKPVIAFGERYYNVSKNVYVVRDYREIAETIKAMINHQFDKMDLQALVYTILSTTQNLGNLSHFEYKQKDLEILTGAMKRYF